MKTPEEIMLKAIADLPGPALPPWAVIVKRQIEALDAAGYVIVPKEPTQAMVKAGTAQFGSMRHLIRTVIAAAQTKEPTA